MAYGASSVTGQPLSHRDRLTRRKTAMWSERSSYDAHIRDIFDQTRPRRTRFTQTQANKGDRRNYQIIDNTGVIASRVLTSGLVNGMSSPAQQWFRYEPEDLSLLEYGPAKEWLAMLERLVRRIFHASNVYEKLPVIYDELGLAGVAAGVIEDDFEDVIRLSAFTWGEYGIAVNDRGVVDTLYRELSFTALQCVQRFGLKNVSTMVRSAYDTSNYDQRIDVMHAIEPNLERNASKADAKNMPFCSVYWEPSSADADRDKFLRKSGYRENPIVAPRWDVVGNDAYPSTCPGMEALGDMRQLQIQQKRKGEAIDKMVRPATQGPSSLADRFISTLPGAHNVVSQSAGGEGIKPIYEVKPDLQWMVADIEDTRQRVEEAFYVPYILAISRMEGVQPKNQMEISERKGEGLLVLGPVVQRLQNELHNPLHNRTINRIYEICIPLWQLGEPAMLPPPPPELQGMPLAVSYVSPLAQIQKQAAVAGTERLLSIVASYAEVFPGMVRKIDEEQTVDVLGDQLGVAHGVVRSDEQVSALAEADAQQKQMEQIAAMAAPVKDAAQAAKALGETNIGGGEGALEALMGQASEAA